MTKFFWIKNNGQLKELTSDQYRKMVTTQFRGRRNLLVKLERTYVAVTHGEDAIIIPLKQLKQIIDSKPPQPKLVNNAASWFDELR